MPDFQRFIAQLQSSDKYARQIVHMREVPAQQATYADTGQPLSDAARALLDARGVQRLYAHQATAIDAARAGDNVVLATGTASGKSLGYVIPLIETLVQDPSATAFLLFPTKALSQDQFRGFSSALQAAELDDILAGVYDGDTPASMRRKLRDHGSVIFTNPDMLHAGMMAQHARWANFIQQLRFLVIDELHVYNGMLGSNMANLMRRFFRVCAHYEADPQVITCSATIRNPRELAEGLVGKPFTLIDEDGSPRGKRTYVFWNPPRIRRGSWRSRRSANVEAHELMAKLIHQGIPTIAFSKAKMTAEMIYRYVTEKLGEQAPHLAGKVTPYRGGYLPEERREIERKLFAGELLGVSTTAALELGIDVGGLDAAIVVGYPGKLASFFQQSGRAGRRERDALVILVGLDTTVNQYVMTHPEYIFGRAVEQAVTDEDNPFVITGHLRCAAHELPIGEQETKLFGPHADMALRVLQDNHKVVNIGGQWFHAASEVPQHEVAMRDYADKNVVIEDSDTGKSLGQVNKFDAQPILHPDAIYMHYGDTYRVLELDLDRNIATVEKVEVDYYTQPLGGTDIEHIDHQLREKPFGTGKAFWGEATAYFNNDGYEKIHFYSLDAISRHGLELPTWVLETMAFWLELPEELMAEVLKTGKDAFDGLRGIGYATRNLLPTFMTCETLDFSHTVGCTNSPWHTVFVYERYPLGLGFSLKAYEMLHEVMPAVLDHLKQCSCRDGCPVCTGKPLRGYTTWNVERGEASIPSRSAAIMVLEGFLGDGTNLNNPDTAALTDDATAEEARMELALRRRLERMREPEVFHPIEPRASISTEYPGAEDPAGLDEADVTVRAARRTGFERDLSKRLAKKMPMDELPAHTERPPPSGMTRRGGVLPPDTFAEEPRQTQDHAGAQSEAEGTKPVAKAQSKPPKPAPEPIQQGDSLAARARRMKPKKRPRAPEAPQ